MAGDYCSDDIAVKTIKAAIMKGPVVATIAMMIILISAIKISAVLTKHRAHRFLHVLVGHCEMPVLAGVHVTSGSHES